MSLSTYAGPIPDDPPVRSVYDAAEAGVVLGLSERTVRRRARAGILPTVDLGGRALRFPKAAIDRLAAEGSL